MSAQPSSSIHPVSPEALRALNQRIDELKSDVRDINGSLGDLRTDFTSVAAEIRGFIATAKTNLEDHETRIRGLERARYYIAGAGCAAGYILKTLLTATNH